MQPVTLAAQLPPDLPEIAGFYSQLAGVLAGFSFAGVIALVTIRRDPSESRAPVLHSVTPLTSAFVALIASSLDYALVAGENAGTARVASLQTTAGMGFSIAGIMLVFSILVLMSDLEQVTGKAAIDLLRSLVVLILPTLLVLLMWGGVRDHVDQKYGDRAWYGLPDWLALGTLAATVTASVAFRLTADRSPSRHQEHHQARLASAAALLAFASLIGSATLITLTGQDTTIPDAVPLVAMLVVGAFGIATAYAASRYRPTSKGSGAPDGQGAGTSSEAMGKPLDRVAVPSHRLDAALDPLDRSTLVRRSVEIFPQSYLMNISIIQGVALSVIAVQTVNQVKQHPELTVPTLAQALLSLIALITVSYEYLWFTTVMRWTPTFRDTAIPVVLGVGEIVPPLLMGMDVAWWLAFAVFALLGAVAFINTITRLREDMFPGRITAYRALRRLLLRLVAMCGVATVVAVATALLVDRYREHAAAISTASAVGITAFTALVIVGYSEAVLNRVYADYGVGRQPPLFARLRPVRGWPPTASMFPTQSSPDGRRPTDATVGPTHADEP